MLVDAHVHVHSCFSAEALIDGAFRNFRRAASELGHSEAVGCLMLAEMAGAQVREELVVRGAERLVVVPGRQIVTRERLEVLALGRDVDIPDGLSLSETLARVRESGALPVLPWGFGKWWGRRGALVEEAIRSEGELYLGDNSGRLRLAGMPRLLREARRLVLPGTDPLPFPDQAGRAGSFGFVLEGPLDLSRPAEDLLRRIRALREQPPTYGRGETLPGFLRNQASLQLRQVSA